MKDDCEYCFKELQDDDIVVVEDCSWFCSEECKNKYFEKEEE
jgi:hypothetical protein